MTGEVYYFLCLGIILGFFIGRLFEALLQRPPSKRSKP